MPSRQADKRGKDTQKRVPVLLPVPVAAPFDYLPGDLDPAAGSFVRVPVGARQQVGVVWLDFGDADDRPAASKLKPIAGLLPLNPLSAEHLAFIERMARYTLTDAGMVLRLGLGGKGTFGPAPTRLAVRATGLRPDKITDARQRVLEVLGDSLDRTKAELAREAGVSTGVIDGLVQQGVLTPEPVSSTAPWPPPDLGLPGPTLTPDQKKAATQLRALMGKGFAPALLDGVTGSGKTEVYFDLIAALLVTDDRGQVLVLVPEIALTTQLLERFEARFGAPPVPWHSELTPAQRRRSWHAVNSGQARIVVGARSALFLPFQHLAGIVVDEEHDTAYKQEDGVIYQGRDMAVLRASFAKIPVLLVSATPSIETSVNCDEGKYARIHLLSRHGGASLPATELVDMRASGPASRQEFISPPLRDALIDTFGRGEQALLFLNRRGYAPLTLCRTCGHRLECPSCSAWLVEHRRMGRLRCHHCDFSMPIPASCPSCGDEESLVPCGPGVERLSDEVAALFPNTRRIVLASDTLGSPASARQAFQRIADHAVDLVIGTQLVTKGHHFPMLTLVGVVDGDLGLEGGDLRAAERTFQQLWQVAGRAGRGDRPGRVLLQTYSPEHPVMQALAANDPARFYAEETETRRRSGMPPFGRLVAVVLSCADEPLLEDTAQKLVSRAPHFRDVLVYGPAPAPIYRLRGRYRLRFLVKSARGIDIQKVVRTWLAQQDLPRAVRCAVDVDPQSFF